MADYRIALVPGDGVGPEVISSARQVLEAVAVRTGIEFAFASFLAGKAAYDETGNSLPDATLDGIRNADAALMGAMSTGLVPPPSPMGVLRRALDLYADVRPIQSYPGVWCLRDNLDLYVVRENTEGFLADRNLYKGSGEFMPDPDTVLSLRVITRKNSRRIARFCFELARNLRRKKITVAHKANVLRLGCGFFLEIVREAGKEYPEITLEDTYVDSVANDLVRHPERFDVILTTNLFGDILSDEAAALVSSLVPTANFGADCALFRPIHEALLPQPGKNVANPLPTILCGQMMLDWLGETEAAWVLQEAVRRFLADGKDFPADLGGSGTTTEVTVAVCRKVKEIE
ncbi:MAG: isocitrate/isopropylmalate dehydrogenase family protein [Candidatus Tectomicrobia bacterium]|uniref:Isocitrate/isopropylmalate dehydrogenase family protein n=1 Tax=Tectimicrobiota bacterium TaxID=2528274 RepID=A0A932GMD2_UNCTE|nr:isocitrate/isopropylmalate dehydrogenase family protein [Candidatus Tectomicrobia bacterium]